jgi:pimeloyl-ACP methyl ester carboxylesterase
MMVDRQLRTSDAVIAYSVTGSGAVPIVFVHGWGCGRGDWDAVIDGLPDRFTAIAIDLPGHGQSSAERADYSIAAYANDVADVIRAENVTSVVIAGHSMGGAVAVELAGREPSLVERVIGVDSLHYLSVYPRQDAAAIDGLLAGFGADMKAGIDGLVESTSVPTTSPQLKAQLKAQAERLDPAVGLSALAGLLGWDLDDALTRVDAPITVLAAEPLLDPQAVERYGDRLTITTLAGAGHYFLLDEPVATSRLIEQALTP